MRLSTLFFCFFICNSIQLFSEVIQVTVTGDGVIEGYDQDFNYIYDPVGTAVLSFSYDTDDLTLVQTYSFGAGSTGSQWELNTPAPVSLTAGGQNYSVDDLTEISMFDQPTSFDQVNFSNPNVLMQWNDSTSSAFTGPITTDFNVANTQIIDQITNNPNLQLSNGAVNINPLDGNYDLTLNIENANVVFQTVGSSPVPEPNSLSLMFLSLMGITLFRRKR